MSGNGPSVLLLLLLLNRTQDRKKLREKLVLLCQVEYIGAVLTIIFSKVLQKIGLLIDDSLVK